MFTFIVFLIDDASCLFKTERLKMFQNIFQSKEKGNNLLMILLRKQGLRGIYPLWDCIPPISKVFLKLLVSLSLLGLWQLRLFILNYYNLDSFKDIMKCSCKKKYPKSCLLFTKYFGKIKIAILFSRNKIFYD